MNIKEARNKHGMSQQMLSDIMGIPKRSIENWETGARKCPEYVERLVVEHLEQRHYKAALEELQEMVEHDAQYLMGDAKRYAQAILTEIKDILK